MHFEWDEQKRQSNIRDHGLDFAEACKVLRHQCLLTDEFFARSILRMPRAFVPVTMHVEPEVLEWFKAQGADYERRMNAALRIYVEAHKGVQDEQRSQEYLRVGSLSVGNRHYPLVDSQPLAGIIWLCNNG
jgi:uncharacterized protein (DUF4415 family)